MSMPWRDLTPIMRRAFMEGKPLEEAIQIGLEALNEPPRDAESAPESAETIPEKR